MTDKLSRFERFGRAIQKSLHFFQKKPHSDTQLSGRIQELTKTSKEALSELVTIKAELSEHVDPCLFGHVEAVLDPLIKELTRIQKVVEQETNPTLQVQVFRRYSQWIDKANAWIHIKKHNHDKISIEGAVIQHILDEFYERIERDLQVINDYQQHMIDNLPLDDEERGRLWVDIETKLGPFIKSLLALKKAPANLPIERLSQWKLNVDQRREKYFDGALFMIDHLVEAYSPDSDETDEHNHLVEIFERMAELEEEAPKLYQDAQGENKEGLSDQLDDLEDKCHQLNVDLRLTPELIDRLQAVSDLLQKTRMMLQS